MNPILFSSDLLAKKAMMASPWSPAQLSNSPIGIKIRNMGIGLQNMYNRAGTVRQKPLPWMKRQPGHDDAYYAAPEGGVAPKVIPYIQAPGAKQGNAAGTPLNSSAAMQPWRPQAIPGLSAARPQNVGLPQAAQDRFKAMTGGQFPSSDPSGIPGLGATRPQEVGLPQYAVDKMQAQAPSMARQDPPGLPGFYAANPKEVGLPPEAQARLDGMQRMTGSTPAIAQAAPAPEAPQNGAMDPREYMAQNNPEQANKPLVSAPPSNNQGTWTNPYGLGASQNNIASAVSQAKPAPAQPPAPTQAYQDPREYKAQQNPEQANKPFVPPAASVVQQPAPATLQAQPGVQLLSGSPQPAAPAAQTPAATPPPQQMQTSYTRPPSIKEDPNLWTPEAIARSQANASAPRTVSGNNPYMTPAAQGSFSRPQAPALVSGSSSPAAMSQYAGTETAGPIGAPRDAGQMATDDVVAKVRQSIAARPKGVAFNPRAMNTGIRGSV